MKTTSLELKHISKAYEGKPLLADISFCVKAGETVCLLGSSGSGKSTLLRMIAGLETPDSGLISFDGVNLVDTPPHLRDFGLVFQDYELFPHLNVFENVAFGLRMRKIPSTDIDKRVATLLEQMNLNGFALRKVTDLSGGEQQRVALARALATQPRLLMFDEPLGALDRSLKEDLLEELRTILHKSKIPVVYVTHDQEEAFVIAERILLLHDGGIVREGSPADIWSNPGSAWAAGFLGVGNLVEGIANVRRRVKTAFGDFALTCAHKHAKGEKIPVLIRQSATGREQLKLQVQDVLFSRDRFQVRARGGLIIQLAEKPRVGQVVRVRVKVECLHEDSKKNLTGEVVFQYAGKVLKREEHAVTLEAFFGREDMALVNVVLKKGDRFVETFYTDRWYNIFEIYDREDKKLKGWYCNIGKPAMIQDETVSYVDLALDLWVAPDGLQTVLDEDELNALDLTDDVRRQVRESLRELQELFKSKRPPF